MSDVVRIMHLLWLRVVASPARVCGLAFAGALAAAAVGLARRGAWRSYLPVPAQTWDTGHYVNIALRGYAEEDSTAFYPLWPALLRLVSGGDEARAAQAGTALAWLLFLATLPLMHAWLVCRCSPQAAAVAVLLFAWSPFSTFHGKPYTESLFGLLWMLAMWTWHGVTTAQGPRRMLGHVLAWVLLSTCRPVLLPAAAAVIAATAWSRDGRAWTRAAPGALAGLVLGYLVVGAVMVRSGWDFFQPFLAQAQWGKSLSFRWHHIVAPATWGDDMLGWDLLGLYAPPLLLLLMLARRPASDAATRVAALFAAAHSAIVFATQPELQSLGRYILGAPPFFLALAPALEARHRAVAVVTVAALLVGAAYLVKFWSVFPGGWVG